MTLDDIVAVLSGHAYYGPGHEDLEAYGYDTTDRHAKPPFDATKHGSAVDKHDIDYGSFLGPKNRVNDSIFDASSYFDRVAHPGDIGELIKHYDSLYKNWENTQDRLDTNKFMAEADISPADRDWHKAGVAEEQEKSDYYENHLDATNRAYLNRIEDHKSRGQPTPGKGNNIWECVRGDALNFIRSFRSLC